MEFRSGAAKTLRDLVHSVPYFCREIWRQWEARFVLLRCAYISCVCMRVDTGWRICGHIPLICIEAGTHSVRPPMPSFSPMAF